jgi:hypothetical protein
MIKAPQTSIEAFLYNAINIEIYKELEENYLDEINTLDFFNLLYSELEFYLNNSENYLAIEEHFDAINFKNSKLTVKLFHWLPKIIKLEFDKRETSELEIKTLEVIENNYFLFDFAQEKSTSKSSFDAVKNNFSKDENFEQNAINTINWQGTELEFTELFKSLIESKKLNPELSQKEIFNRLRRNFNIQDFDETDKIREITNRINTPTPFLNILETALNNYRNKQLEKRKNK